MQHFLFLSFTITNGVRCVKMIMSVPFASEYIFILNFLKNFFWSDDFDAFIQLFIIKYYIQLFSLLKKSVSAFMLFPHHIGIIIFLTFIINLIAVHLLIGVGLKCCCTVSSEKSNIEKCNV